MPSPKMSRVVEIQRDSTQSRTRRNTCRIGKRTDAGLEMIQAAAQILVTWMTAHEPWYTRNMTIKRMDHVSVVVDDLASAIAFFTTLGMELEGERPVEGPSVDRLCGLEGVQADIAMMRTPDGHGRVELTKPCRPET